MPTVRTTQKGLEGRGLSQCRSQRLTGARPRGESSASLPFLRVYGDRDIGVEVQAKLEGRCAFR
jgi:hypothetical protein